MFPRDFHGPSGGSPGLPGPSLVTFKVLFRVRAISGFSLLISRYLKSKAFRASSERERVLALTSNHLSSVIIASITRHYYSSVSTRRCITCTGHYQCSLHSLGFSVTYCPETNTMCEAKVLKFSIFLNSIHPSGASRSLGASQQEESSRESWRNEVLRCSLVK